MNNIVATLPFGDNLLSVFLSRSLHLVIAQPLRLPLYSSPSLSLSLSLSAQVFPLLFLTHKRVYATVYEKEREREIKTCKEGQRIPVREGRREERVV